MQLGIILDDGNRLIFIDTIIVGYEMELEKAIFIIKALADGVDPYTGEQFPSDSPYQSPDSVRALVTAIAALEKQQKATIRQQILPSGAGKSWSDEEDNRLLQAYDAGTSINDISKLHARTVGAIKSRLVKHGEIKNS